MKARFTRAVGQAVQQEAHRYRAGVIETFNSSGRSAGQQWEPNKPSTIRAKGSSKPLIDKGDLRKSLRVHRRGQRGAFIGISSKAVSRDGTRLVDVARVHEFGRIIAIRVTAKMLRFLHATMPESSSGSGGGGLKVGSILMIRIPERSFLRSTFKQLYGDAGAGEILKSRIAKLMGPGWRQQATRAVSQLPGGES